MTDETYNGWPNYETWNVALWIDNEEAMQNDALQMARDARELPYPATSLEDTLRDWITDMSPLVGNGAGVHRSCPRGRSLTRQFRARARPRARGLAQGRRALPGDARRDRRVTRERIMQGTFEVRQCGDWWDVVLVHGRWREVVTSLDTRGEAEAWVADRVREASESV